MRLKGRFCREMIEPLLGRFPARGGSIHLSMIGNMVYPARYFYDLSSPGTPQGYGILLEGSKMVARYLRMYVGTARHRRLLGARMWSPRYSKSVTKGSNAAYTYPYKTLLFE